jgi:hypothetical protein
MLPAPVAHIGALPAAMPQCTLRPGGEITLNPRNWVLAIEQILRSYASAGQKRPSIDCLPLPLPGRYHGPITHRWGGRSNFER